MRRLRTHEWIPGVTPAGDTDTAALGYPGRMASRAGLLDADGVHPWSSAAAAMLPRRSAVLAIGSNGDPAVLQNKLVSRGASPVVPLLPVVITGISIAHSAHVSLSGYVAATPRDDRNGAARGVLIWLDPQQRAVIDATEPNYQRVSLSPRRYQWAACVPHLADEPAESSESTEPTAVAALTGVRRRPLWVYRSMWGVLTLNEVRPLPFGTQHRLHRRLAFDPVVAERVPLHDPAATARALADQQVQVWLRRHWARAGHTAPDGLVTGPR
jgi:hypothetical protein